MAGTTKTNATITLERKNPNGTYAPVMTRTSSADNTSLFFIDNYSVTKGYTYKLTVIPNVTRNGVKETVSNWTERLSVIYATPKDELGNYPYFK